MSFSTSEDTVANTGWMFSTSLLRMISKSVFIRMDGFTVNQLVNQSCLHTYSHPNTLIIDPNTDSWKASPLVVGIRVWHLNNCKNNQYLVLNIWSLYQFYNPPPCWWWKSFVALSPLIALPIQPPLPSPTLSIRSTVIQAIVIHTSGAPSRRSLPGLPLHVDLPVTYTRIKSSSLRFKVPIRIWADQSIWWPNFSY